MYLDFYGLSEKPFSQTPDPRFLYWNDAYRETLASLRYGIQQRKGFIAMIGEAGTGKTTLLRKLLDDLGPDVMSVFLFNPNATFEEILEYTLSELGITAPTGRKLAMLQRLNEFLLAAFGEGRNTILIIDEAQDLQADVLESLRLLSNLETAQDKILQIVLSGQPELADKLADPGLRQLKQRIAVRCRLEPLKREELGSFISARLAVGGGTADLFSPETLEPIWQFTSGIPRLINTVCDNSLLLGYALGKREISAEVVCEVIADLRQLDIGMRPPAEPSATRTDPAAAAAAYPAPVLSPAREGPPEAGPASPTPVAARDGVASWVAPPPAARNPARIPWLVAAALAGALLLFVGAWLGRDTSPARDAPDEARSFQPSVALREPPPAALTRPEGTEPSRPPEALGDAPPASPELIESAKDSRPAQGFGDAPKIDEVESELARVVPTEKGEVETATVETTVAAPRNREPIAGSPPKGNVLRHPVAREAAVPEAGRRQADAPDASPPSPENAPEARPRIAPPVEDSQRAERGRARSESPRSRDATTNAQPAIQEAAVVMGRGDPTEFLARPAANRDQSSTNARDDQRPSGVTLAPPGRRVAVRPGDTLLNLAAGRYGTTNLTTLDMLLARNPEIRSMDLIIAGSGLNFPEPGPDSRLLEDGGGLTVLAMTTARLSEALALQTSLEGRLGRPVSLQRLESRNEGNIYRVSVRGLADRSEALDIAKGFGSILRDPAP